MKGFRYAILLVAGFCLGWGAEAGMGIAMRKSANSRFLDDSQVTLGSLRAVIAKFSATEKRFPKGVGELIAKGYLDPTDPPVESMHRGARWVGAWDGQGGFLYLSATGEIYLNADVSREKFLSSDWPRVLRGDLFPKGEIF
jgi:hypothetical protein